MSVNSGPTSPNITTSDHTSDLEPRPSFFNPFDSSSTVGSSQSQALSTPATSVGSSDLRLDLSRMGQSTSIDSMLSNNPALANIPPTVIPYLGQVLAELEANPSQFTQANNNNHSIDQTPVSASPSSPPNKHSFNETDLILSSLSRIATRLEGKQAEAVEPRSESGDQLQQLKQEYEAKLAAQQVHYQQELEKSQIHHDEEVR